MNVDVRQRALMAFLKGSDARLHERALEVRDAVGDWLSYVPQTFPHYTRHTIPHSDTVILQISRMLFREGDPSSPTVPLSPMEAYIACVAALLHDAGMVVSDQERARMLGSDEWRDWIGEGAPGSRRWAEVEALRASGTPEDPVLRNFLADVQLRFLMAEFVRRSHHLRARDFLEENREKLGGVALGDPLLLRTIGDVCVAHGLDRRDLEDRDRYPDRRDVLGHQVNVRFLAILLRLGDLLDMSTDRACPLLLSAACPLPAESLAQWTQYQRLTQFLVSPDRIEVTARCQNQDEHRTISDWCRWLVDEASNATVLMARAARHGGWSAPTVTMDCPDCTIKIQPAPDATYIPSNWRFELDNELVFQRLVRDLYGEPLAFVRELIQNALDATRCELYLKLGALGQTAPAFPTQAPEDLRERLAVSVSLETRRFTNPLSGEAEERQVLCVEDPGIGMDREIIEKYLLQIGRSYYTTAEFQRGFGFVPISRFGLGFLSVFAVSDYVTIETVKPSSGGGPLRVVLTGPRNYVLLEKGARKGCGTRIEVRLREPLRPSALADAVSKWCRRVEFPVVVEEQGATVTIRAESKAQFIYEMPDIMREGSRFAVRAFEIERRGLEGELYIFARVDEQGESWDAWGDAYYDYPRQDPRASRPPFPDSLICIQGLGVSQSGVYKPYSHRIDFRGEDAPMPSLSREDAWASRDANRDPRIVSRWEEILTAHLAHCQRAHGPEGWKYKQALADDFALPRFWATVPEMIPLHYGRSRRLLSLGLTLDVTEVATVLPPQEFVGDFSLLRDRGNMPSPAWDGPEPALFSGELRDISKEHRRAIFGTRSPSRAYWLPCGHLAIIWRDEGRPCTFGGPSYRPSCLAELPDPFVVGFEIDCMYTDGVPSIVLNSKNSFVRWVVTVRRASETPGSGVSPEAYSRLYEKLQETCVAPFTLRNLAEYVKAWARMSDMPTELTPPDTPLQPSMFARVPHAAERQG